MVYSSSDNGSSMFSVHFAGFEWVCFYAHDGTIKLMNKEIFTGKTTNDVHMELFLYDGKFKALYNHPIRHVFNTSNRGVWVHHLENMDIHMTIRILVERPFLPDFTLKDVQICGKKNNGQLRVGGQTFYINKEILSIFSNYFDRMFNGNFNEAKQDVVNLESETTDPALFHDFLLTISLPGTMDALPNRENVATLLELARFYDVDLVRNKCKRHLKFCREMPREERIVLGNKYGFKDLLKEIVQEATTVEEAHKICYKQLFSLFILKMADYEKFVVVAEDEWKLHNTGGSSYPSTFSFRFAGFEWECSFNGYTIKLTNKEISTGKIVDVHAELVLFDGNYKALYNCRQIFNTDNKGYWEKAFSDTVRSIIVMTIRILVDRPFLPDFTLKDVQICGKKSNGQLRVGDQTFFINKEILSMFSNYFDRMFNGDFDEADQDVVKLESENCDPELFHDFLLTICLPGKMDALPNRDNVTTLLELATFYDVELVRNKCERHLKICREMPREKCIVLAKKYGLVDLWTQIVQETPTVEELKKISYKLLDEF